MKVLRESLFKIPKLDRCLLERKPESSEDSEDSDESEASEASEESERELISELVRESGNEREETE